MLPRHDGVDVVNLKAEKASEPVQSKIPRVSSLLEHPFSFFPKPVLTKDFRNWREKYLQLRGKWRRAGPSYASQSCMAKEQASRKKLKASLTFNIICPSAFVPWRPPPIVSGKSACQLRNFSIFQDMICL